MAYFYRLLSQSRPVYLGKGNAGFFWLDYSVLLVYFLSPFISS